MIGYDQRSNIIRDVNPMWHYGSNDQAIVACEPVVDYHAKETYIFSFQ